MTTAFCRVTHDESGQDIPDSMNIFNLPRVAAEAKAPRRLPFLSVFATPFGIAYGIRQ